MHVRVCVECGEEYRPEIVACADCGGRLEDRHDDGDRTVLPPAEPAESGPETDAAFTEMIFQAQKVTDLRGPADRLVEAGIGFRLRPAPGAGYRLLVAAPDLDRTLALLGLLGDENAQGADGAAGGIRTCPACGAAVQGGAADCPDCGLGVGDEPEQLKCDRCGQWLDGPDCPDCGR